MAPWTNLAAATPVAIGMSGSPSKPEGADKGETDKPAQGERGSADVMTAKQVNDAAAYIRGLANMRGRNAEWAERAVREAVSLSAEEALEQKVIDYLATDLNDLLRQLDGKTLPAAGVEVTLATAGAPLISHAPDWRTRLLAVITNPSVALILMMIGVYGLFFEFSKPGSGIGGVLGGISLILALYALQLLPVNYAGVALILLGIPLALIVTLALTSAGLILAILGMALKARRRQQVAGDSGLVGSLVAVAAVQAEDPCQNRRWCRFCSEPRRVSARSSNRRSNAPWSALSTTSLARPTASISAVAGRRRWA
jgi:membrane-bound serine protease (ClpP class)